MVVVNQPAKLTRRRRSKIDAESAAPVLSVKANATAKFSKVASGSCVCSRSPRTPQ